MDRIPRMVRNTIRPEGCISTFFQIKHLAIHIFDPYPVYPFFILHILL